MDTLNVHRSHSPSLAAARRRLPGLFAWCLVMLALSACSVTPPQVRSVIVDGSTVSGATNDVQIVRAGAAFPAAPGTPIEVGDEIVTGPGAQAVMLLENGAVEVILMENSELRISSIFLKVGEAFVRIAKKLREQLEVGSEYGIAGAEGTEFLVHVRPDGRYRCVVFEGQVAVRPADGAWAPRSIRSTQEIVVVRGSPAQQRTLPGGEFNDLIRRVNAVERAYRPTAMQLMVPDVTGLAEADARNELRAQSLGVGESTRRVTGTMRVGEVLRQAPAAGQRITPGGQVRLEVEAQPTTVPDVTSGNLETARRTLARARLKPGEVREEITGERKAGSVLRQRPAAGERVPVDSEVELWVEAKSVRVPQLVRANIKTARQRLEEADLAVGRVEHELVEGQPGDRVLEQSVAANEPVAPGTPVDLVVTEAGVRVPDLRNNSRSGASRILSGAGLKLGGVDEQPSNVKTGAVIAQDPPAETLVRKGSAVAVTLSQACVVPEVRQMLRQAAYAAIRRAGFVPRVRQQLGFDPDRVFGQAPGAGQARQCGSAVDLDLGTIG